MSLGRPGTNLRLLYGRLICDLASDGAKVRNSGSFFRTLMVLARSSRGRFPDLDRLVMIMFRKYVGLCASSITRSFSDHSRFFRAPVFTDAAGTKDQTRQTFALFAQI